MKNNLIFKNKNRKGKARYTSKYCQYNNYKLLRGSVLDATGSSFRYDQDRVGVLESLFFEGSPQQLVYSLIFVCQSDRL